jgi:hypothetical protein
MGYEFLLKSKRVEEEKYIEAQSKSEKKSRSLLKPITR